MSEFKPKRVFNEPLDVGNDKAGKELNVHLQFDETTKFVPAEVKAEPESDESLDTAIKPSTKRRWGVTGLLAGFTGLVAWQTVDTFFTAFQSGDWLTFGWSAFVAGLASVGIGIIGKELWKLKKLRQRFSTQDNAQAIFEADQIGKAKPFCASIAKQAGIDEHSPSYDRWVNAINANHSDQEVLQMYDCLVLRELDKKGKELITRSASESALLVAVSPLATADMILVAWRNFKLIDQLAKLYGVELGYWSRIKLLKLVLVNMAAAGATELVADASMDLLSMDLAGKVSTRVAQGIGVGLLTARLGIRAMSLLRPIRWQANDKIKLGEVRKGIVSRISKRVS
ncbi:TIGR01620 family protein [Vibrio sp. S9_S30]|uniref:YcjF family protein n=1 Tax=Vibrio sp. S9_S30 TaxID=2720226 RepID=UPI0016819CA3|nr:TIGR01620 family protein [Vibrio sp. S9_S30]MBD1558359.1 TIGR01620 family protein [Vibrio sp. S9_S30]